MKTKIINSLKTFLLVFPAIIGLDALYSSAWYLVGLPTGWWTSVLLAAISGVSEYAIILWIGGNDNGHKKKLIELLKNGGVRDFPFNATLADHHLIANGVTVQEWIPCYGEIAGVGAQCACDRQSYGRSNYRIFEHLRLLCV